MDGQFVSSVGIGYHPAWWWASTAKGGREAVLNEFARPLSAPKLCFLGPRPYDSLLKLSVVVLQSLKSCLMLLQPYGV